MNNTVIIILAIALALTLVGGVIFTVALAAADWDFSKLDGGQYSTNAYSFDDSVSSITISVFTADVNIIPSSDNSTRVVCYEKNKFKHEVAVEDGNLVIDSNAAPKWYESSFTFSKLKIDIYLPEEGVRSLMIVGDTGDVNVGGKFSFSYVTIGADTSDISFAGTVENQLKIETDTGDVKIEDVKSGDVDIKVSTGDINIENLECKSLKTIGTTGDIEIEKLTSSGAVDIERSTGDVVMDIASVGSLSVKTGSGSIALHSITCPDELGVAVNTGDAYISSSTAKSFTSTGNTGNLNMSTFLVEGTMNIERNTGDVKLNRCDAGEVYVTTDTGDVVGSFISDKIIFASSNTGKIDVPKSTVGGKCEITTTTGKIIISIVE